MAQRIAHDCDIHLSLNPSEQQEGNTKFMVINDEVFELDMCPLCSTKVDLTYEKLEMYFLHLGRKTQKYVLSFPDGAVKKKAAPKKAKDDPDAQIEQGIKDALLPALCEVKGCEYEPTATQGYGTHLKRTHGLSGTLEEKRFQARKLK